MNRSLPPLLLCSLNVMFSGFGSEPEAHFLSFSVRQKNGIYVRDLEQPEVSLTLDDEPVEIRFFGYQNVETSFVLLIENSPRTARYNVSRPELGKVNIVDTVRYNLVDEVIPEISTLGPVWIGQFYQELETVSDFSTESWELTLSLQDMEPRPKGLDRENIPLGRFLGRGYDLLRDRPEKRKVILLFAATVDHESLKHVDEYREMFRSSDIDLYAVSFGPRQRPGLSSPERFNTYYFSTLVGETAGKFYLSADYVFPSEFMNDLMTTLSNSYTIGFYVRAKASVADHAVKLEVSREGVEIRSRRFLRY